MAVLADLVVPGDEFVLAEALTSESGVRVEIKRVVAGTADVTPFFWAFGDRLDDFESALSADSEVRAVDPLETTDEGERFYRVSWDRSAPSLLTAVADAEATILEAVNDDDGVWELKVLFPDRGALSAFHDYCLEHDFGIRLERVYSPENPEERGQYGVTDDQQEALVAAYHAGYFEVPRSTTLADIAGDLGISRNAASARLRRGHRNLLASTLVHDEGSGT
ncbi:helix-turn-helix domain-containing protein [Halomicrobium salinisoli]|uniref:helix-turn-helix domain-containing protein n=1 Tax=Halomicrobium salinisoli TaxID=2878391 RepID=UPI001CF00E3C|nr:helix-turn-helix domain-containing protein [Halomicrobium salinisoli]